MILSDKDILSRIKKGEIKIKPFKKVNLQQSTIDLTLDSKIRVFENYTVGLIDVKDYHDTSRLIDTHRNGWFILHPGRFLLGSTVEEITVPNDLAAKLEGRSSWGRLGLIIHATAGYVDPGFSGRLTLEISNISQLPIKLYAGMRIAQIAFYLMTSEARRPYGSKSLGSKYQHQSDATASRIWKDFKLKK